MSDPWLRVVGPPAVFEADGSAILFPTRKQVALLVLLAVDANKRGVHRDRLADLLWPSTEPERGRHSLSQSLGEIRRRLGNGWVNRGSEFVSLTCHLRTDVECVELLTPEPNGYASVLEGFEHLAGTEFAHWVDATRIRLSNTLTTVLENDIDRLRTSGNYSLVCERAQQLYRVNPSSVRAVSIMAEHWAGEGKRQKALQLIDALIEKPDSGRNSTEREVLVHLRERVAASRELDGRNSLPNFMRCPPGRDESLRRLHQMRARMESRTHTVLIRGAPGIGKTTVARHFGNTLQTDGHLLIEVRCAPDQPQFSAVTSVTRALMRIPELGATDPNWLAELATFAPFLRAQYPGIPSRQGMIEHPTSPDSAAHALHHAFDTVRLGRPIVVMLDDIHYLDESSRRVIHTLMSMKSDYCLLILGTITSDSHAAGREQLVALPWHETMTIYPVTLDTACTILATELSEIDPSLSENVVRRLAQWSRGNPLLMRALARLVRIAGTASIGGNGQSQAPTASSRLIADILGHITRHYEPFWSDASIPMEFLSVRQPLSLSTLSSLCDRPTRDMDNLLRRGMDLGVLDAIGTHFSLSSPVFEHVIRGRMCESRRQYCHARISTQRREGRAGERRISCRPSSAATTRLDEALLRSAERAARNRDLQRLRTIAVAVRRNTRTFGSPCWLSTAFLRMIEGDYWNAYDAFRKSVHSSPLHTDVGRMARAHNGMGSCALALGHFALATSAFRVAFELAERIDDRAFAGAIASNLGVAYADYDFQLHAERWFARSFQALEEGSNHSYQAAVWSNYIDHRLMMGDVARAHDALDAAERNLGLDGQDQSEYLLCARADLLLAQREHDHACDVIAAAQNAAGTTAGKRLDFLMGFDSPHLTRLSHWRSWLTESAASGTTTHETSWMPLAQQAEVWATLGWCGERGAKRGDKDAIDASYRRANRIIRRTGATGVIRRLQAVGLLGNSLRIWVS